MDAKSPFDDYQGNYEPGMDSPVKRLLGQKFGAFISLKLNWLLADLQRRPLASLNTADHPRLLDFGCGNAIFLDLLSQSDFNGTYEGCDTSQRMLDEGAARWPEHLRPPLHHISPSGPYLAENSFDIIIVSGVIHHILPGERDRIFMELFRMLKPGGRLFVFEHNPYNPLTRWMVSRSPFDEDAVLLTSSECQNRLRGAGGVSIMTRFIMFFPPRFSGLQPLERGLGMVPFGGQYVCTAEKSVKI